MPYALITFVEADRVWFKSRFGIVTSVNQIHRNVSFDSFTILNESPEVFVVRDVSKDKYFSLLKSSITDSNEIKFYAGTPIIVDNVKIGALSIMDINSHEFTLEQKENLLDLGGALSTLVAERRETALHLRSERANIVVTMMHNLRTPMTSLNFATSLLSNDVESLKLAQITQPAPPSGTFDNSFHEISHALNQLNLLVDTTLCLGHAIIKCNAVDVATGALSSRGSAFMDFDLLAHLEDIYNKFARDRTNCKIDWEVDKEFLSRGKHASYPDAILLVLISSIGYISSEFNNMSANFTFIPTDTKELEFPEYVDHIIEGMFFIKIYPFNPKSFTGSDNKPNYNYLSIDKILKSIRGGFKQSEQVVEPTEDNKGATKRTVHEFWVPCRILIENTQLLKQLENTIKSLSSADCNGIISAPAKRKSLMINVDGTTTEMPTSGTKKDLQKMRVSFSANLVPSTKPLSCLVVEDTISVQKLLSRWLTRNGCSVTCANNGKIGLESLKTTHFDIVFIDYLMVN